MHSAWAQPDPASQTTAGSQENACVLYSWICLNINSYRRDKYRLHPGSTGRHQASSPCAHTHTHQHPSASPAAHRGTFPASLFLSARALAWTTTQYLYIHNISQMRGTAEPLQNGAEQPEKKTEFSGYRKLVGHCFFSHDSSLCLWKSPGME